MIQFKENTGQMEGQKDGRTEGWMDRRTEGQTKGLTDPII